MHIDKELVTNGSEPSLVEKSTGNYDDLLNELGLVIDSLEAKLSPVIVPHESTGLAYHDSDIHPHEDRANKPAFEPCPLVYNLERMNGRLRFTIAQVRRLHSYLAL